MAKFSPIETFDKASSITIETIRGEHRGHDNFITVFSYPEWKHRELLENYRSKKQTAAGHAKWVALLEEEKADLRAFLERGGHVFPWSKVKVSDRDEGLELEAWLNEHAPGWEYRRKKRFFDPYIVVFDKNAAFSFKMRWL